MEVQDDAHGQGGGIVGFASVALRPGIVQAETWSILVSQDPNEAYAPLRLLMWKLVAFGMLVFAVVALLRWRLGRRIVQPINALVERVQLLGQQSGEKPMMATQSAGIVEIDTLAASFDELAERLERASRERRQYVAELERANQELVISEEHYRMLWDHSTDTRLLVNEEGIIQDVNRRGETNAVDTCRSSDRHEGGGSISRGGSWPVTPVVGKQSLSPRKKSPPARCGCPHRLKARSSWMSIWCRSRTPDRWLP